MNAPGLLTKRETDVIMLVAQGKHNKEIALDLGISENTVESHLQHIYAKIAANSRTEAVLIYLAKKKIMEIRD